MLSEIILKFKSKSEFANNILKLGSSSLIAMLVYFITLPIITRIYDPAVFGEFQILLSVVTLFSVVSSFKYEMAIVMAKTDKEASYIFTLNIIILLFTTVVVLALFYFFGSWVLGLLNAAVLEPYVLLLVFGVFLAGLAQIAREILVRNKKFTVIAQNRVAEVSSAQGLAISFGLIKASFLGLFLSQVAGYVVSIVLALGRGNLSVKLSRHRLKIYFLKHLDFLKYNTPSVFLNTLSVQLPIFFIAKSFGIEFVGYYMLAVKLMDVPIGVVSGAISQVYYKEAVDKYKVSASELFKLYNSMLKKMFLLAAVPSLLCFLFIDEIIIFALGLGWEVSGYIASVLVLAKFTEFLISPISVTLTVINCQKVSFYAKLYLSFGLRLCALLVFNDSFEEMLWAISLSTAAYYVAFNLLTFYFLKRKSL